MTTKSDPHVNRAELVDDLMRGGFHIAADHVRHGTHPGNTAASLTEVVRYHEHHGNPGAAEIIRAAIRAGEQAEASDAADTSELPDRAAAIVREMLIEQVTGAVHGEADVAERMVGKLAAMRGRAAESETGLDAEDALTWQVRQVLYNSAALVEHMERLTVEHLEARDNCSACGGSNTAGPGEVGQNTECPCCGPSGTVGRYPHQLGDQLREWFEERCGVGGLTIYYGNRPGTASPDSYIEPDDDGAFRLPEFADVLVQSALPWIDWNGLARELIGNYIAQHGDPRPSWAVR